MNRTAEVDALLRHVADAFRATLHATLDGDRDGAREVADGTAGRRGLADAAHAMLTARRWVPAPQLERERAFVDGVDRIGELVEDLAAAVADGALHALTPTAQLELTVLLDVGDRRLRQLIDGAVTPEAHATYRGCAAALIDIAGHSAGDPTGDPALRTAGASVTARCSLLAAALLVAGRQAAAA